MGKLCDQMKEIEKISKFLYSDVIDKAMRGYDEETSIELGNLGLHLSHICQITQAVCNIEDFSSVKMLMEELMDNAVSGAKKISKLESKLNDEWIKKHVVAYNEMFLKIDTIDTIHFQT